MSEATSLLFHFQINAPSLLARLRLLNVLFSMLRRLNPRRLDVIFDLKPELSADFYKKPGTRQEKETSLLGTVLTENEPGSQ